MNTAIPLLAFALALPGAAVASNTCSSETYEFGRPACKCLSHLEGEWHVSATQIRSHRLDVVKAQWHIVINEVGDAEAIGWKGVHDGPIHLSQPGWRYPNINLDITTAIGALGSCKITITRDVLAVDYEESSVNVHPGLDALVTMTGQLQGPHGDFALLMGGVVHEKHSRPNANGNELEDHVLAWFQRHVPIDYHSTW